jgi:class 3 adenylate cyclase
VALHAGTVIYGNIGAADRLDFTVIGPAVNLVSREEAVASQHREQSQVRIIVSRRGFTTTHWYACADLLLGARTRVPF